MASDVISQKSVIPLVLLLLAALVVGYLILSASNVNVNVATQNASDGQCQDAEKSFDEQQEAFTLALEAEQYRTANPIGANYGLGSYTICYKDGTQQRVQSIVYKGFYSKTQPINDTHSEQIIYGWLQNKLSSLSLDRSNIVAIYAVIFSQVKVCDLCVKDMKSWQRVLRQKARTNSLYLSVWDIIFGQGFVPSTYPAGNGTPITIDALRKVPIRFFP